MRVQSGLITLALLAPVAAQAQTSTADGVAALLGGDHANAARILRPLAADAARPDPLAAFFMAIVYDSQLGVAWNEVRACAWYLQAAVPDSPVRTQAQALAEAAHRDIPILRDRCVALSRGTWDDSFGPRIVETEMAAPGAPSVVSSRAATSAPNLHNGTFQAVDAIGRGSYVEAAEVLESIVNTWPWRDHLAEFLMATLYENGYGVAADRTRACALYMRASLDTTTPFARQAQLLMRRSSAGVDFDRCVLLGNIGFQHQFEPVTFALEPGQWISLDLDAATIAFEGSDTRVALTLARGGVVFLPVKHTELTAGPANPRRRHFIEFFSWIPLRDHDTRTLLWHVFEVVGNALVRVTYAELATTSPERAMTSATDSSFDVTALAQLRVNDDGEAEWAVLAGPDRGTRTISAAPPIRD
jgi:TPR repeat protein